MSSTTIPADRGYTTDHEWVMIEPGTELLPGDPVRVGITSIAVAALGDLVYLDLPEVGSTVTAGEHCGEVESTKAVSDLYSPVTGRVTLVNAAAMEDPTTVGADPYHEGWLFAVLPTACAELLTAESYFEQFAS